MTSYEHVRVDGASNARPPGLDLNEACTKPAASPHTPRTIFEHVVLTVKAHPYERKVMSRKNRRLQEQKFYLALGTLIAAATVKISMTIMCAMNPDADASAIANEVNGLDFAVYAVLAPYFADIRKSA